MNSFFATLYEYLYYQNQFSNAMFQNGLYWQVGIFLIILSIGLAAIFYYVINRPFFSRWWAWLIVLGVNFLLNLILGLSIPLTELTSKGFQFSTLNVIPFAFVNALYSAIVFVIFSFIIRWGSVHAKGTPIPN